LANSAFQASNVVKFLIFQTTMYVGFGPSRQVLPMIMTSSSSGWAAAQRSFEARTTSWKRSWLTPGFFSTNSM
jgi:hypothetical protein